MASVTPEKNEGAYRKWESMRRWLILFWVFVSLYIAGFVVCPLVYPFVYPPLYRLVGNYIPIIPVETVTASGTDEPLRIFFIVIMGTLYAIILIVMRWRIIKRMIGRLSKEACTFAAIVTAEDLEKGNSVRASLSIDRLLLALNDFLGQKLVALGARYVAPLGIMSVTPETIPRRAVYRAIQASEDTKDFQERLRNLAVGLCDDAATGYLPVHQFIIWLDQKTEPYHQVSKSFLEKRPALKTMLLNVFPLTLPPLAGIIIAVLPK